MAETIVDDCYYNVHKQLVKRLQFLWNLDSYIEDSKKSKHSACAAMWEQIRKNEQKNVELLKEAVIRDNEPRS